MWTKERLEQLVTDGQEEGLALEYKGAGSLQKTEGKKAEITKDVSAFANSSGGILIYGIAEFDDRAKRHLPECIDPIDRREFTKEWLEQVIQSIQPRIDGVMVHPVTVDEESNSGCYVVEIQQSHTAHQARDHVYYKRHNFNVLPMEDYEVRDVMNRRQNPKLTASIFVNRNVGRWGEGLILVKLRNVSSVMARYYMVDLEIPTDAGGEIVVENARIKYRDGYEFYTLRLRQNLRPNPLFPASEIILENKFQTEVTRVGGKHGISTTTVVATVFADEMPSLRGEIDISSALAGWAHIAGDPIAEN